MAVFISSVINCTDRMDEAAALTAEQEDKIRNYRSEALAPPTPSDHPALHPVIVDGKLGKRVCVEGRELLNAATHNYLGMIGDRRVEEAGLSCLQKYGVGACGPRTFFGTVDVHLALEGRISGFLGTEETAIYSLGFSTISSAIPAYAKPTDVLFVDEGAHFAIQKGVQVSKCTTYWFKHNDMADLERCILEDDEKHGMEALSSAVRRFLVVEGVYQRTGRLCPLSDAVTLARRHRLRVVLDESVSLGVLGTHGRGATEHFSVNVKDIDLICGSLEHALGSYGGFTSGAYYVVDHQRLNGLGYVFSASLPPMLAASALRVLEIIDNDVGMIARLRDVCDKLHTALDNIPGLTLCGDAISPIKLLQLTKSSGSRQGDDKLLRRVTDKVRDLGVLVTVVSCLPCEEVCPLLPSIRVTAAVHLLEADVQLICVSLQTACTQLITNV